MNDTWSDSYEVCIFLQISERTLQRLCFQKVITYSMIAGKAYYTIGEIKKVLQARLIRSSDDNLNNLVEKKM